MAETETEPYTRSAIRRDDLTPDMTPGACTHISLACHLGGDLTRWTCSRCKAEVGSDRFGNPLSAIHPLWPAEFVPTDAILAAVSR